MPTRTGGWSIRTALGAQARGTVLDRLREAHARVGVLPGGVVREAAAQLGCSPRTVRRWLVAGTPAHRQQPPLEEEVYRAYVRWHGNVAAARRDLIAGGREVPSLRSLQRAVARGLPAAERAAVRTGEPGLRAHGLYVRWQASRRNEVWQGDHKQLDVLVLAPRCTRPRRPWSTIFIDAYSRAIVGWALSLRPSSAEVLAALRAGMLLDLDSGLAGGVPERLRIDHGFEFCAGAVRDAAAALDVQFSLAARYTPQEKGKIERLQCATRRLVASPA